MKFCELTEDQIIAVTDPVCGGAFDLGDAAAHEHHDGWAYFFCSNRCRDRFLADPDGYANQPNRGTTSAGARHET